MIRPETKKKPAERFSILVVPQNNSNVRRYELSGHFMHAVIGLGLVALMLIIGGVSSLVYYRHAYLSTESVRVEAAEFAREKAGLMERLANLESALSRTERFAAKIESATEKRKGDLEGKGPVDEADGLPLDELSTSSNVSLGSNKWKSPFSKSLTANLNLSIGNLEERANSAEEKVHSVFALQQDKLYFWASLPSTWPARGFITSEFGEHRGWGGRGRVHEGIDVAAPTGTPIFAPGDGVVTFSGYYHGYGQMVTVDHGNGISTLYGHCSAMFVTEGQRVKRGMLMAKVGNTGRSTGSHLHYEVHVDGVPVNPMKYILQ